MDFLFHKVSEEEKEKIKKEAKSIMDSFSEKLTRIEKKLPKEDGIERPESEREEKEPACYSECNKDFRDRMFNNAPEKNENFIIAEKKGW